MLGSTHISSKAFVPVVVLAAVVLGLLPAGASATQYGTECAGTSPNFASSPKSAFQIERAAPAMARASAGVITRWAIDTTNASVGSFTERLTVFQEKGEETAEVLAQSVVETVKPGVKNFFATRIPVTAGVVFGVQSADGFLICPSTFPADQIATVSSEPTVGATVKHSAPLPALLDLAVTVEPDADGDGYGDETQDGCPTNVLVQTACPTAGPGTGAPGGAGTTPPMPTTLTISSARLEGNTVAVKLSSTVQTQVTVIGTVRGKQGAPTTKVTVVPGAVGRAYLTLSKGLRQRLAKLPRKQKLMLVIEAQAPGAVPASRELPLSGRRKPAPRHHPA